MSDALTREVTTPLKRRTQLEYQARVDLVVAYIQQHLDEPITLEKLAGIAHFSPYHIHRIFSAFLGESPGEYIRQLRLGRACQDLVNTRWTITEIGLAAGYETPAAFTRAFRHAYRVSPSQMRRQSSLRKMAVIPASPVFMKQGRYPMEAEIRTFPDRKVIFVTSRGMVDNTFNLAAKRSFDILSAWIDRHHLGSSIGLCLGICPDDVGIDPKGARYQGGFVLEPGTEIRPEGDIETTTLPGGRWAVLTYRGSYDGLTQAWQEAYRDWLPASGEQLRDTPPYEVYLTGPETRQEERVTEIHIALE